MYKTKKVKECKHENISLFEGRDKRVYCNDCNNLLEEIIAEPKLDDYTIKYKDTVIIGYVLTMASFLSIITTKRLGDAFNIWSMDISAMILLYLFTLITTFSVIAMLLSLWYLFLEYVYSKIKSERRWEVIEK